MIEQTQSIFNENILGVLGTVNEDGSPWATPLHIVADDQAVYWFSSETAVHSQNIVRDSRVSLSLFSPDESQGPKGVYVNGSAEKMTGEDVQKARDVFAERIGAFPAAFEAASAYRLPIGELDAEKSTGSCWYFYS